MSTAINHDYRPVDKYIINHDIMHCTTDEVVGNYLYSGRALGLSEPWDIIQIHPELKTLWRDICHHYQRIGLRHSENVIWDVNLEQLGSHIGYVPSVFNFGVNECTFWGDHRWLETVEYINSKNNFMSVAKQLNINVPKTVCFDNINKLTSRDLAVIVYPCYLKGAVSVSGVGIYRCENEIELKAALPHFTTDTPIQIQEEVSAEAFLNMQYRIIGDNVIRLAASEQILEGFAQQRNRVPASHEPWDVVEPMAHWLKDHGIKGIFSFDVAITQTESGLRFLAIECNPRFNGSSYPTLIAQKLDIPQWSAINFSTRYRTLADIDLSEIEYDHKTGEGAIIVNWGTVLEGKLMIMMAGTRPYQEALEVELKARL